MRFIRPRERASSAHAVDYGRLWETGIRALLFDLDNTLARWRAGTPPQETAELLTGLRQKGFKLAVVSNGRLSRNPEVLEYFSRLGVPVIWPAAKPLPTGFNRALKLLGARPGQTAVIGDQLLTDVLGGNLLGLYTVLVEPLDLRRESMGTRLNRALERFILRRRPGRG